MFQSGFCVKWELLFQTCCSHVAGHYQTDQRHISYTMFDSVPFVPPAIIRRITTNVWMRLMWAVDQKPFGVRNGWISNRFWVYMYFLSQVFRQEQRLFPSHFGLGWPHVLHALNASDAVVRNFAAGGSDIIPETSWTLIAEPTGLTYNKNPTKWSGESCILQEYRPEWIAAHLAIYFSFYLWVCDWGCAPEWMQSSRIRKSSHPRSLCRTGPAESWLKTWRQERTDGVILTHNPVSSPVWFLDEWGANHNTSPSNSFKKRGKIKPSNRCHYYYFTLIISHFNLAAKINSEDGMRLNLLW